ncbi:MAG TPA: 50S ribosomal protein L1 [Phycisphaerae bacterium]|nr:50S ribosomal protein L1 [Phycisphaerae bacterium]HOJ72791.1 50S ribosomal protein L1 [Phycisphaerae bacterium]HOM51782.1 50S ribosomal protein L1 [Phycisphaerae bacterium]HON66610.1 50S ribosomal protein L1 [Phycisphaerae bacterium]HOQ87928.1 50S ribosomal protein L1 [Phycisphaerae bacterium]
MPLRSATYRARAEKAGERNKKYPVAEAVNLLKTMAEVKPAKSYKGARKRKGFDQTVELVMHLGIDPKQADQMIRGSVSLPKGIGASKRVIAFCPDEMAEEAKAAGAVEAGGDDLIKKVSDGWLDFDVAVAHPQVMGKVGKLGRVLGPQGKMPSPKSGTVTPDIATAVREYAAGKLEYRNDAGGNIHAVVGKLSFAAEDLKTNIEAFIDHIRKVKPTAAKGQYIRKVAISATMTPSVLIDLG